MQLNNENLKDLAQDITEVVKANWKIGYNEGWRDCLVSLENTLSKLEKELGVSSIETKELIEICQKYLVTVMKDLEKAEDALQALAPDINIKETRTLN